jgi:hypothetical protein
MLTNMPEIVNHYHAAYSRIIVMLIFAPGLRRICFQPENTDACTHGIRPAGRGTGAVTIVKFDAGIIVNDGIFLLRAAISGPGLIRQRTASRIRYHTGRLLS